MEDKRPALLTRPLFMLALLCTAAVWVMFLFVVHVFVPQFTGITSWLWAGYGATVLSGVFFIAFHMLAVVIRDPHKEVVK